jgi:hypothetical protein
VNCISKLCVMVGHDVANGLPLVSTRSTRRYGVYLGKEEKLHEVEYYLSTMIVELS